LSFPYGRKDFRSIWGDHLPTSFRMVVALGLKKKLFLVLHYVGEKMTYSDLTEKHVFITGGASGIGESFVRAFVGQGAKISFIDIDDDSAKKLCENIGKNVFFQHCDIRNIQELQQCVQNARTHFGPISVLINNAAKDDRHGIGDVNSDYWDNCQNINLRPHFFTAQSVVEDMKMLGGGSIINLSSNSFLLKVGGMPGYLTAKAAIVGLTRALARDLGEDNIRVNAILPGWVITDRQRDLWLTEEAKMELLEQQCIKKLIYPEEVANLAMFLASSQSKMITAQSLIIDAGRV
jgi:galactose dehydrogenase